MDNMVRYFNGASVVIPTWETVIANQEAGVFLPEVADLISTLNRTGDLSPLRIHGDRQAAVLIWPVRVEKGTGKQIACYSLCPGCYENRVACSDLDPGLLKDRNVILTVREAKLSATGRRRLGYTPLMASCVAKGVPIQTLLKPYPLPARYCDMVTQADEFLMKAAVSLLLSVAYTINPSIERKVQ